MRGHPCACRYQGSQNQYILLSLVRTKTVGHVRDGTHPPALRRIPRVPYLRKYPRRGSTSATAESTVEYPTLGTPVCLLHPGGALLGCVVAVRRLVVAMSRAKLGLYIFCRYAQTHTNRSSAQWLGMRAVALPSARTLAVIAATCAPRRHVAHTRKHTDCCARACTTAHARARAHACAHNTTAGSDRVTHARTLAINSRIVCACAAAAAHRSSRRATSCSRRSHSCSGGRPSRSCCWQRRSPSRAARMRRSTRRSRRAHMHAQDGCNQLLCACVHVRVSYT